MVVYQDVNIQHIVEANKLVQWYWY